MDYKPLLYRNAITNNNSRVAIQSLRRLNSVFISYTYYRRRNTKSGIVYNNHSYTKASTARCAIEATLYALLYHLSNSNNFRLKHIINRIGIENIVLSQYFY